MNRNLTRELATICAVSTPQGQGGISVIRISGAQSLAHVRKLAPFLPETIHSHHAYVGILQDQKAEAIDEVVILPFLGGRSFTGEESVEISCHGSPAICQWILNELVAIGCRVAEKGEFTLRAFQNGRLDLVQAEGVLEMIQSESKRAAKQALNQLRGGLSDKLKTIEDKMVWLQANIEASLDFSGEGLQVLNGAEMQAQVNLVHSEIQSLLASYRQGKLVQEGMRLVLSGLPNAGKSSLLNLLVEEERAIVSEIAGTTRDWLETTIHVEGISVRLVDTAGLRETQDPIEKMGIDRTREIQRKADYNLYLFDASRGLSSDDLKNLQELVQTEGAESLRLIGNKVDLVGSQEQAMQQLEKSINNNKNMGLDMLIKAGVFWTSCFGGNSERTRWLSFLGKLVPQFDRSGDAVLTKARQYENLQLAEQAILRGKALLEQGGAFEFLSVELQEALLCVQNVLGRRFDDDVMDRVFQEFCIGK